MRNLFTLTTAFLLACVLSQPTNALTLTMSEITGNTSSLRFTLTSDEELVQVEVYVSTPVSGGVERLFPNFSTTFPVTSEPIIFEPGGVLIYRWLDVPTQTAKFITGLPEPARVGTQVVAVAWTPGGDGSISKQIPFDLPPQLSDTVPHTPEPSTALMLGLGIVGLAWKGRRA